MQETELAKANLNDFSILFERIYSAKNPEPKASPAPVLSIAFVLIPFIECKFPFSDKTAPGK